MYYEVDFLLGIEIVLFINMFTFVMTSTRFHFVVAIYRVKLVYNVDKESLGPSLKTTEPS